MDKREKNETSDNAKTPDDDKLVKYALNYGKNATEEDIENVKKNMSKMNKGPLKKIWDKVLSLWKAFQSPETPKSLKALVIGSLIYMVSPMDLVPDIVPFAGLLDDVAIISLVYAVLNRQDKDIQFKSVKKSAVIESEGCVNKGDIICTQRSLYMHYGVYIGDNRVIHFSSERGEILSGDQKIIETGLDEFLKGDNLFVVKEKNNFEHKAFPPDEIVRRAKSELGNGLGKYHLIYNNCEHFAYWCRYGVSTSKQVESVLPAITIAAATIILA